MPPRVMLGIALAALLSGCASVGPDRTAPPQDRPPTIDRAVTEAALLASYLEVLQRVVQGQPAEQAEILSTARHDFETAPTASHELRFAMVLATPGHPGTDCAKQTAQIQRLQTTTDHSDRDRYAAAKTRLQSEMDENARLHKELDDAHTKLDAIANIERALNKPKVPGGTPQ
jgi:hypothetical protein